MLAESLRNANRISSLPNAHLRTTHLRSGLGANECVEPTPTTASPQMSLLSAQQLRLRLSFSRTPPPRLPKQNEGAWHGVRGSTLIESATASVLSSSLIGVPVRFIANGLRLPCRTWTNHVRSFPRNTAQRWKQLSPIPPLTSTDSSHCCEPSDHAPGHQLASNRIATRRGVKPAHG